MTFEGIGMFEDLNRINFFASYGNITIFQNAQSFCFFSFFHVEGEKKIDSKL